MTDKHQKQYIPLFCFLIFVDFIATWLGIAAGGDLDALTGLWFGPLDDVLYGIAGVQAFYAFLDPQGKTRGGKVALGTIETVKKIGSCLVSPTLNWSTVAARFFEGSQLALVFLPIVLAGALLGDSLATFGHVFSSLALGVGRHLSYVVPIFLISGVGLSLTTKRRPDSAFKMALSIGLAAALGRIFLDGRIDNHLFHFFASLSSLQAWGAACCWIGVGNELVERAVPEMGAKEA